MRSELVFIKILQMLRGWEAYYDTLPRSGKMDKDKKMDYISPQTYWRIGTPPHYDLVVNDWKKIIDGRFIYPGIALFKLEDYIFRLDSK